MSGKGSSNNVTPITQGQTGPEQDRIYDELQAPLINIRGFTSEVHNGLETLAEFANTRKSDMPKDLYDEINSIVNEDMTVCMEYLEESIDLLTEKLENLQKLKKKRK